MPKMKSNRGARKRFKVTATGKIIRSHAYMNHILTKKSAKQKRRLSKSSVVSKANRRSARIMLTI